MLFYCFHIMGLTTLVGILKIKWKMFRKQMKIKNKNWHKIPMTKIWGPSIWVILHNLSEAHTIYCMVIPGQFQGQF
jgi:hypothetical protein